MYPERNNHHPLWERRDVDTRELKHLGGLLLMRDVLVVWHNDLHANMPPPVLPEKPLTHNLISHIEAHRYSQGFDNMFTAVDYLRKVGNPDTIMLAEHFTEQLRYLTGEHSE